MAHIVGVASVFPEYYYSQDDIIKTLRQIWSKRHRNLDRLEQFHRNVRVKGRHLALPLEAYLDLSSFGESNQTWIDVALDLGETVVCDLLAMHQIQPQEISQLTFTTVTGIAVPSIEARLMNRVPFSRDLKRVPLFGLGCLGGAAGVARVADYLKGHPDEAAILLSIELCSLTMQPEDLSIANIISSGLFGDGAAAVLMVGDGHRLAREGQPRVVDSQSIFFPDTEHIMGWDVRDTGLKVILSADVSEVAEVHLRPVIDSFLDQHGLAIQDITHWISHPGGPKVMQSIEKGLDLDNGALRLSWESLAEVGNISSTSVLLVLQETLKRYPSEAGTYGLLVAMGPAFCAELVLLQW